VPAIVISIKIYNTKMVIWANYNLPIYNLAKI